MWTTQKWIREEFKTTSGTIRYGQVLANGATVNSVATQPIGVGSVASIAEGVYFISGSYVYVAGSDIILDAYSNTPSYLVGLTVTEEVIDSSADSSLADNATGTTNLSAPGANPGQEVTFYLEQSADVNYKMVIKPASVADITWGNNTGGVEDEIELNETGSSVTLRSVTNSAGSQTWYIVASHNISLF